MPRSPYHGNILVGDIFAQHEFLSAPVLDAAADRARPNLKIQDGCNNRCSFCIIPFVRGPSRSAPAEQVVEQVRALSRRYREIVLSGINLGRWGRELSLQHTGGSPMRLADLIRLLLAETDVERLRLSSVEPMDLSDDLLGLMAASPRIAKHVHAPLQSGSRSNPAPHAPQVPPAALRGPHTEGPRAHAGCGHRRRRHGGVSRRNRCRFRGEQAVHRSAAVYLFARVHLLGAAGHARRRGSRCGAGMRPQGAEPRAARTGGRQESPSFASAWSAGRSPP